MQTFVPVGVCGCRNRPRCECSSKKAKTRSKVQSHALTAILLICCGFASSFPKTERDKIRQGFKAALEASRATDNMWLKAGTLGPIQG